MKRKLQISHFDDMKMSRSQDVGNKSPSLHPEYENEEVSFGSTYGQSLSINRSLCSCKCTCAMCSMSSSQLNLELNRADEEIASLSMELEAMKQTELEKKRKEIEQLKEEIEKRKTELLDAQSRGKTCTIIGDLLINNIALENVTFQVFPEATIASLTQDILSQKACITPFDHVIIHVGTNDLETYMVEEMLTAYTHLITVIKGQSPSVNIILSAILPRPVDHTSVGDKIRKINNRIKSFLAPFLKIGFIHSYRPFIVHSEPIRELFAMEDGGFDLNLAGRKKLENVLWGTIRHCENRNKNKVELTDQENLNQNSHSLQ